MAGSVSVSQWLEGLKKGYGERFAGAFEDLGAEDVSDLAELADVTGETALRRALESRGARTIQIQRIRRALDEALRPPPAGVRAAARAVTGACAPRIRARSARSPAAATHGRPPPAGAGAAAVPGLVTLHDGDGPRVYMVHGIDGDISGAGYPFRGLAPNLDPCNSCALAFDGEAAACDSIPSLALLYNQRVMADAVRHPHSHIVIAGYSLGCVIAHQMALQFQNNFTEVGLILFGFEACWPPSPSWQRVGGYEWLGGEVEAALLLARALPGGQEWAAKEAQALLRRAAGERDASDVQERAFAEVVVAGGRKSRWADFQSYVARAGRNMDALHRMTRGAFRPPAAFAGRTLLVLAPESPESSRPARLENAKYCSSLEVVYASGTHFNMLQKDMAPTAASSVLRFLTDLAHLSLDDTVCGADPDDTQEN